MLNYPQIVWVGMGDCYGSTASVFVSGNHRHELYELQV